MSERRVFESLCLDPGKRGFSYDSALMVDVDHAADFDEAVIRLTTKCNSIITQLRSLGHHIAEFSVAAAKVGISEPKSPTSRFIKVKTSGAEPSRCPIIAASSTPDGRNLKVMEERWCGLKQKNYSGMVAVARLTRSSIPRNGSGSRYSVRLLTEALLSHIQAYFMFQSYNPDFQRWATIGPGCKSESTEDEYLVYLAYRIRPVHETVAQKKTKRQRELNRLEISWPFEPSATRRRRRHTSGESSVSSSSSASSNRSGGATFLSPPMTRSACLISQIVADTPRNTQYSTSRVLNSGYTKHNSFGLDCTNRPTPRTVKSSRVRSTDDNIFFHKTPMSLRSKKGNTIRKSARLSNVKPVMQRPRRTHLKYSAVVHGIMH
ncbi:uncharacterized protein [Panulirus ornatus]|uniref:uncharacterized protein isoform X2 n=1 Tax=Panulirus ornatus TaxID=150431 RepID=UPI003A8A01C5